MSIVIVPTGANIQSYIGSNPAGTTFQLSAGTYYEQSFTAQSGDQFIGDPSGGTILSGAAVLTNWFQSGSYWKVSGLPAPLTGSGDTTNGNPLANDDNDLFIDNRLYLRVSSLSQVTAGKWYFDPSTNSVYISDNPAGHTVEYSETPNLSYDNGATGVVFSNITVEKYASAAQQGVLHGVRDWTLTNDTFEWNHGTGVVLGAGSSIQGGHYVHNGQEGIGGYMSDGAVINGAEIAYNNWAGYNPDWDAGGLKMCTSANVTVTNNNVHDNYGMGIWADIDSWNWTITGNTVTNNAGNGIMYEISHGPSAKIDNNTVSSSSRAGIYISNSDGVEASGNTVTVGQGNTGINGGIDIINDVRGSGPDGVYQSVNDTIKNNTVIHANDTAQDGIFVYQTLPSNPNDTFNGDTYYVPSASAQAWYFGQAAYNWTTLHQQTSYEAIGTEDAGLPSGPLFTLIPDVTVGSGNDILLLKISEDAYANGGGTSDANGDANYTVLVDGKQIGGTLTATALHSLGQDQNLTVLGNFGQGNHAVTVKFLNDAFGGTATTDRNLYVDDVVYEGTDTRQSAKLACQGAKNFTVTGGTPAANVTMGIGKDTIALKVSEDYYLGNAQYTVSLDGLQIGGTLTATASHSAGQDQVVAVNGDFGPGKHTIAVTFLNDAYGGTASTDRNLYIDDIIYKGTDTEQSAPLLCNVTKTFTVTGGTTPAVTMNSDHGTLSQNLSQTGTYNVGGDTFVLGSNNTDTVTLGSGASQITFLGPNTLTLTGGSGTTQVEADRGTNTFTAGSGTMDVTGGGGKDSYQYLTTSGKLPIEDFSLAKGDTLYIQSSLQASMVMSSDKMGGTMLSFGAGLNIDLKNVTSFSASSIHWN